MPGCSWEPDWCSQVLPSHSLEFRFSSQLICMTCHTTVTFALPWFTLINIPVSENWIFHFVKVQTSISFPFLVTCFIVFKEGCFENWVQFNIPLQGTLFQIGRDESGEFLLSSSGLADSSPIITVRASSFISLGSQSCHLIRLSSACQWGLKPMERINWSGMFMQLFSKGNWKESCSDWADCLGADI